LAAETALLVKKYGVLEEQVLDLRDGGAKESYPKLALKRKQC